MMIANIQCKGRRASMPHKTERASIICKLGDSFFAKKKVDAEQRPSRFKSSFTLTRNLLGEGTFSTVKRGYDRDRKSFAVKVVKKKNLEKEDLEGLRREIDLLSTLQHPNILSFHKVYDEEKWCYIVTEIMRGGDLFDRVSDKSCYEESEAREVCKKLFDTIKYCHEKRLLIET